MSLSRLEAAAWSYSFLRAMSILRGSGLTQPGAVIAASATGGQFPATDIASLRVERDGGGRPRRAELRLSFFGLGTVHSSLPEYFHEVLDWERLGLDSPEGRLGRNLGLLFDLIDSRMFHLLHEIWERTAPVHATTPRLVSLIQGPVVSASGFASDLIPRGLNMLQMAPFLLQGMRNAWGLKRLLERFLSVDVAVRELEVLRVPLAPEDLWRLGARQVSVLGRGTRALSYRITRHNAIRASLGPLGLEEYLGLLPGGERHALLEELMAIYMPSDLEHVIEYTLREEDVPAAAFRLGTRSAVLGATTVLGPRTGRGPLSVVRRGADGSAAAALRRRPSAFPTLAVAAGADLAA